jgi:hypothetical protein
LQRRYHILPLSAAYERNRKDYRREQPQSQLHSVTGHESGNVQQPPRKDGQGNTRSIKYLCVSGQHGNDRHDNNPKHHEGNHHRIQ